MNDLFLLPFGEGEDELERVIRSQQLSNGLHFLGMLTNDLARKDPTLNFFINIEKDRLGNNTVTEVLDYLQENTRPGLCDFSNRRKPVNPKVSEVDLLLQHVSLLTATIKQCHEICSKHPPGTDYEIMKLVIEAIMENIGNPTAKKRGGKGKNSSRRGKNPRNGLVKS